MDFEGYIINKGVENFLTAEIKFDSDDQFRLTCRKRIEKNQKKFCQLWKFKNIINGKFDICPKFGLTKIKSFENSKKNEEKKNHSKNYQFKLIMRKGKICSGIELKLSKLHSSELGSKKKGPQWKLLKGENFQMKKEKDGKKQQTYCFLSCNDKSVLDLDVGRSIDGAKVFTWIKKDGRKPNPNQLWYLIPIERKFAKEKNSIKIKSLKKKSKFWIPNDCLFSILQFVHSPLTLLILRQVSQQFYIETERNILWMHFIKITMSKNDLQMEKETKNLSTDSENGLNMMRVYWKKFFPKENKKFLISNTLIIENWEKYFTPVSPILKGKPCSFSPKELRHNNQLEDKMTCLYCGKNLKINVNILRDLDLLSFTYEASEYGGCPAHHGYCSKKCFNDHIIKPGGSNFNHEEVYERMKMELKGYYGESATNRAFENYTSNSFFEELKSNNGRLFVYISFGGPSLQGFFTFKNEKDINLLKKSLLYKEYTKYNVGMFYLSCSARMGGSYKDRIIYFLYK